MLFLKFKLNLLTVEDRQLYGVGGDELCSDATPVSAADHRDPIPGSGGLRPVNTAGRHRCLLLRLLALNGRSHTEAGREREI